MINLLNDQTSVTPIFQLLGFKGISHIKYAIRRLIISLFLLGGFSSVFAETSFDSLFRTFTRCDSEFFQEIQKNPSYFQQFAPIKIRDKFGWFTVNNRRIDDENESKFQSGAAFLNIPISSYIDGISINDDDFAYTWGFRLHGKLNHVLKVLHPHIHEGKHLRKDDKDYIRLETSRKNSPFQFSQSTSGLTQLIGADRALVIRSDSNSAKIDYTVIYCSLEGRLTEQHMESVRPDLLKIDYPNNLREDRFIETQISSETLENANILLKNTPYLQPKFKSIKYSFFSDNHEFKVKAEALNTGLIIEKSTNDLFNENITSISGLFVLKKMLLKIGSGKVIITENLKALMPTEIHTNAGFNYSIQLSEVSEVGISPFTTNDVSCQFQEEIQANTIHSHLTGKALIASCDINHTDPVQKDKNRTSTHHHIFLEDLGYFLRDFDYKNPSKGSAKRLISFDIER